jgi:hypothetical protein
MLTRFIHPETGIEYNESFITFVVISDRLTIHNYNMYGIIVCLHSDYAVAKEAFDIEVANQTNTDNPFYKSVKMIYNTRLGCYAEGLIVHKWKSC